MEQGLLQCRGHLLQVQHVAEVSELLLPQGARACAVKAVKELLEASFILVLLSFIHPIACHAHLWEEMGQVTIGGLGQQKTPRAGTGAAHEALWGRVGRSTTAPASPIPLWEEVTEQKDRGGKACRAKPSGGDSPGGWASPMWHVPVPKCHFTPTPGACLAQLEQLRCCRGKLFP